MDLRSASCTLVVLTALAVQPALAAAPVEKPAPSVQALHLAEVPMKDSVADNRPGNTLQATDRDNVGFQIGELFEAKACPGPGNATFTYTIGDGCQDGIGLYVRFFDETNDLVFPNSSQVYVVNSGRTSVIRLSVKRGAKICLGAERSDLDGYYWGVDINNDKGCAGCCNVVPNTGNIARGFNLICP